MITIEEKLSIAQKNIRNAIEDYWRHSNKDTYIKEDISKTFIKTLAEDNYYAKNALRQMLRKSPMWDEKLDAVVINGETTHDPDYEYIRNLAIDIFRPSFQKAINAGDCDTWEHLLNAVYFFSKPDATEQEKEDYIKSINAIAPDAYVPGKKLSRVFKAICVKLNIADETPNSEFQRNFAKIADEMSAKKISFKLFLSINPAHFLTMSNPKGDDRGECMTSCHSFNSEEYDYNGGCTGYARDNVTMIAFTVSNPDNPETLNNRKTTRQLFMYKPGSGILLQSRMYNTSGGTRGAQQESKTYRALVQNQIALCENVANLWNTPRRYYYQDDIELLSNNDFTGYPDWNYEEFDAILSIRKDVNKENIPHYPFKIGAAGICIKCGQPLGRDCSLYCNECDIEKVKCEHCGQYVNINDSLTAYEGENSITICGDCAYQYYTQCDECGAYYESIYQATNRYGETVNVCDHCLERAYVRCENCGVYIHRDNAISAYDTNKTNISICRECADESFTRCNKCNEYYDNELIENGLCPDCTQKATEEKHETREVA